MVASPAAQPAEVAEAPVKAPAEPEVTTVAVGPTKVFVQAGAFTNYQNALRTQLMIGRVSPATISHVLIDNRDFYRVRVGPLATVADADRTLEQVQSLGYPGARIIVDGKGAGS